MNKGIQLHTCAECNGFEWIVVFCDWNTTYQTICKKCGQPAMLELVAYEDQETEQPDMEKTSQPENKHLFSDPEGWNGMEDDHWEDEQTENVPPPPYSKKEIKLKLYNPDTYWGTRGQGRDGRYYHEIECDSYEILSGKDNKTSDDVSNLSQQVAKDTEEEDTGPSMRLSDDCYPQNAPTFKKDTEEETKPEKNKEMTYNEFMKRYLPETVKKTKEHHNYSGDNSHGFWERINSLTERHGELYSLGVALQNLEVYVLRLLKHAEDEPPMEKTSQPENVPPPPYHILYQNTLQKAYEEIKKESYEILSGKDNKEEKGKKK